MTLGEIMTKFKITVIQIIIEVKLSSSAWVDLVSVKFYTQKNPRNR